MHPVVETREWTEESGSLTLVVVRSKTKESRAQPASQSVSQLRATATIVSAGDHDL
jgi:hypothetical protein